MKPGRGGRGGAGVGGVHGVVPIFFFQLMRDVRGEGHLAQPVQHFLEDPFVLEPDEAVPPSTMSITSPARSPSPKRILVPGFAFLPGFTRVSQTSSAFRFKSRISIFAPVPSRSPMSRAGITFVSLMTRQSPGFM